MNSTTRNTVASFLTKRLSELSSLITSPHVDKFDFAALPHYRVDERSLKRTRCQTKQADILKKLDMYILDVTKVGID